ncbi:MAG: glycoside hydrolase family 13 protein [Bacteroidetes bacterium]|nr:glycoside hydrolase family 13 protein [Bacteroidota bacterium]MBU1679698.1 glycoside hydrolase family 13 protein [Bacteroidota bacterium]
MKKYLHLVLITLICSSALLTAQKAFPEWAKGIVWYQIFPERFRNGDLSNEPTTDKVFKLSRTVPDNWRVTDWTSNWFEKDEWMDDENRSDIYLRRYGGDLQGIIDKLDYLKELGIEALYLNPVFDAVSLHKYDGSTFHHIDVNFGPEPVNDQRLIESENPDNSSSWVWTAADSLFLNLIHEVHSRKMFIIIDGVFNHTGTEFWAFNDIREKGIESKYKDWYIVNEFDNPLTAEDEFDYKGWWGIKSLPEINRSKTNLNEGPKNYIFESTKRWMDPNNDGDPSDGINGWRLDVAKEVPIGFWNEWSRLVKSINREAIIVGELWELSPDYIGEDKPFDALMNYNFAFAVNNYLIAQKDKVDTQKFIDDLNIVLNTYSKDNLHLLQNLLDSHDTDRLSSMIVNPNRNYDRDAKEDNKNYSPAKPTEQDYELQKLIAAFQMTFLGAPMIYYGDEVGMWGADDPHCRKPMVWSDLIYDDEVIDESSKFKRGLGSYEVKANNDLLEFYKELIKLRNSSFALKFGEVSFSIYLADKKCFSFTRTYLDEKILICFNFEDDKMELELDGIEVDSLNPIFKMGEGKFSNHSLILYPQSFIVIKLDSLE